MIPVVMVNGLAPLPRSEGRGRDVNPSAGCALEALARVVQYASSPDFNTHSSQHNRPFLPPRQTSPIHFTSLTSSYIRTFLAQLPPHNNTVNMVKAGAGSRNNHSLAVNSSLTFRHNSRRWCRWWYRTGEHPTFKAFTMIISLTFSLPASVPPPQGLPSRRQALPLRCRQHPRCGYRPFSHLLHRPDRGLPSFPPTTA